MTSASTSSKLIAEGQRAFGEYLAAQAAFRQRRALIMIAARGLLQARLIYPNHHDFGHWLRSSAYAGLSRNERACLISLARHEGQLADFLKTSTNIASPVLLWRMARRTVMAGKR